MIMVGHRARHGYYCSYGELRADILRWKERKKREIVFVDDIFDMGDAVQWDLRMRENEKENKGKEYKVFVGIFFWVMSVWAVWCRLPTITKIKREG